MAILMFAARIHHLTSSINRHQERLMEITRRISDLQSYAASIADGAISMQDMMNTPASMFGRMFTFAGYSHNQAMMNANMQINDPGFQAMLGMQTQGMDPQAQQAYMNWVQQSMYKQAREQINKQEARLLNQQEKELTQEKEKLEATIKMEEADLESARKARDKGIEQFAPKYVA